MLSPQYWILLASMFVPMVTLVGIVWLANWRRSLGKERPPVSEKLLRPAGESLRKELERLDERVNDTLLWLFVGPALLTTVLLVQTPALKLSQSYVALGLMLIASVVAFAFLARRLVLLLNVRRDFRLGFAGERAVAEELNQLMLDGCRVFHDVPMEPYGNIDHVVLAPTGIYAIETKARRKRPAPAGQRDHEVVFDGKLLNFPHYSDTKALGQAKHQADRLRMFLSKAIGEPVKVGAILTFPGWLVSSRVKSEIKVLNPKGIRSAVRDSRLPVLPKQMLDRIAHQLDQRCRDVEF
jgi:hypothetical protein